MIKFVEIASARHNLIFQQMSKLSIKQWAEEDRPREKLLLKGVSALSDSELLAILIGSGNDKQSAVELSKEILREAGNDLNRLARMNVSDLMNNFRGIGEAKSVSIIAALELGRRRKATRTTREKNCLLKGRVRAVRDAAGRPQPRGDLGLVDRPFQSSSFYSSSEPGRNIGYGGRHPSHPSGGVSTIRHGHLYRPQPPLG